MKIKRSILKRPVKILANFFEYGGINLRKSHLSMLSFRETPYNRRATIKSKPIVYILKIQNQTKLLTGLQEQMEYYRNGKQLINFNEIEKQNRVRMMKSETIIFNHPLTNIYRSTTWTNLFLREKKIGSQEDCLNI